MYKTLTSFLLLFWALILASCDTTQAKFENKIDLESIPLELTTTAALDKQTFNQGDSIQLLLSLGHNAYIYMYYINASNEIIQILPHENQSSNYYTEGYFLTLPEYKDDYRFIVKPPYGNEKLWIIASDQLLDVNLSKKSIQEIKQEIRVNSKQAYGEYVLTILTTQ